MGRAGSARAGVMINVGKRARVKMQILRTVSGVHCLSAQRTNGADEQCSKCSVCRGQSGVRGGVRTSVDSRGQTGEPYSRRPGTYIHDGNNSGPMGRMPVRGTGYERISYGTGKDNST